MEIRKPGVRNSENQIAPNVYCDQMVIIKATDESGKPNQWGDAYDLRLELEGRVEGLQFPVNITLKGNFMKDENGAVKDWGGAFQIHDFFWETGLFNEEMDQLVMQELVNIFIVGKIPESFLNKLIGKSVWKASYVRGVKEDGKIQYGTYNKLFATKQALTEAWERDRKKGYPKDYLEVVPTNNNGQDTQFPYGANAMPNHPNAEAFGAKP